MINNDDVLNSWKEVASYLGRGVRTVQRWEQELSLPVRRPRGKSRSAVIAFKTELDGWLHESRANPAVASTELVLSHIPLSPLDATRSRRSELHEQTTVLMSRMEQLLLQSNGLCARSKVLSERMNVVLAQALKNLEKSKKKNDGNGNIEGPYQYQSIAS